MGFLMSLAMCRSPSALMRSNRSKECHCQQFVKEVSLVSYMNLTLHTLYISS